MAINSSKFPQTVTFYVSMGIQAARRSSGMGGGWRLYVMAKSLDFDGLGSINRDTLRRFAASLGVSARQWQRWITQARNFGLVEDVQRKTGEWRLILIGAARAAENMGCDDVGPRVAMAAAGLVGKGWKARVWAAYESTHRSRPISRERMQKLTNVPVSTQRLRDSQAGVTRTANYAKSNMRADSLASLRDFSVHKGLFVRADGFIGWRLPDSRMASLAWTEGKGRMKKANADIRRRNHPGLSTRLQALRDDAHTPVEVGVRLFNFTPAQRRASERKLAKGDNRKVTEVYECTGTHKSAPMVWLHCPR